MGDPRFAAIFGRSGISFFITWRNLWKHIWAFSSYLYIPYKVLKNQVMLHIVQAQALLHIPEAFLLLCNMDSVSISFKKKLRECETECIANFNKGRNSRQHVFSIPSWNSGLSQSGLFSQLILRPVAFQTKLCDFV